jgi:hypothetical protein
MPMIAKALADVSADDVRVLLRVPWSEDEQLDFKVTIPHRDGAGRDPWRNAAVPAERRIKDHGRDQLLATMVAFANSYGGDLLIGVREVRDSQPGVAEAFDPLPACEDAAHRLAQAATACIEPQIPSLQVRGIPLEEDGSGVVILRTPRSRMAPHRLTTNKECYHRVRHETLPMTMRQIQDLTFNVARGLEAVNRLLDDVHHAFKEWVQTIDRPAQTHRLGLRVAAVPLSALYIEHVHNVAAIQPAGRNARLRMQPTSHDFALAVPFNIYNWRPALRGSEAYHQNDRYHARVGIYCDGTVKYEWINDVREDGGGGRAYALYPGWYFAMVVNAVEAAERFRAAAGAAAVEYALETEVLCSKDVQVMRFTNDWIDAAGVYPAGSHRFPRYVIGPAAQFRDAYKLVYRDFWNSIGIDGQGEDFLLDAPQVPAA